jgi:hypothetical protein
MCFCMLSLVRATCTADCSCKPRQSPDSWHCIVICLLQQALSHPDASLTQGWGSGTQATTESMSLLLLLLLSTPSSMEATPVAIHDTTSRP